VTLTFSSPRGKRRPASVPGLLAALAALATAMAGVVALPAADAAASVNQYTWKVTADAFVDASRPTTNFRDRELRTDGSPVDISFLRFEVSGLGTPTPSAVRLRVYAESVLGPGFEAHAVSGDWSEGSITYDTAPEVGALLGISGYVSPGWVEVPLEGLVTGDGTYDIALTSSSTTSLKLSSRSSGHPPELVAGVVSTTAWTVSEDAYVDAAKPSTALGTRSDVRVDGSPEQRTYLRFLVSGLGALTPRSAVLKVHAASALASGFEVRRVSGDWSESSITHANAPEVGELLSSSGPVAADTWVEIPLFGLVSGDGVYDVALVPLSNTALRLDAKESGVPAELLADIAGIHPNTPPVAGDISATVDEDGSVAWTPQVVDVQSPQLACSIDSPPLPYSARATVDPDCSGGSFTPGPDWAGTASFTYRVSDGELSDVGTVTVAVTPVNDAPVAREVAVSTSGGAVDVYFSANDVDRDCPLVFEVDPPLHGALSELQPVSCRSGFGTAVAAYTPTPGWTGSDTFSFVVRDPSGLEAHGVATVEVSAPAATFSVGVTDIGWVDSTQPEKNFAFSQFVNLDDSPQKRTFLRFPVTGLGSSSPASVTLRVQAASTLAAGFAVHSSTGPWDESTLTWLNAPEAGEQLATSGPVTMSQWVEIPLPADILTGDGTLDLALMPVSNTNLALSGGLGKFGGRSPAELVITR
jgi:hypothetical protein